jgi:HipA-like protein
LFASETAVPPAGGNRVQRKGGTGIMAFKKFIEWLGFKKSVQAPPGVRAKFFLKYGDLLVGTLSVHDSLWSFEYSEEFRKSDVLRPIVEFPDVGKTYESGELWQFFASRIPSPEQAEVEEILRREHIEENDAVSLLKRFGRRTVANPFHLEAAA